jgi:glycine C-acetyltransferase
MNLPGFQVYLVTCWHLAAGGKVNLNPSSTLRNPYLEEEHMSTELDTKLDWIRTEIDNLKEAGLYNRIRTLSSPQGAWLVVDGKRVLNFCSNNYLGLANHPRIVRAAREAVDKLGVGPAAVRTIAGTMDLHLELEHRLAAFKGVESSITFQSGFTANLATIPALVGKEDAIVSDELNHASIIDGSRLSGARILRYAHCNPADLERVLQENRDLYPRVLVITDGVFSMDGDVAPLDKIYAISRKHNAILMVDDAHGEGVLGKGGRGIVDHFGLHGKVDVEVGTLSKAFGVVGGVVAGNPLVVEWLRQRGRPFLFSSAMTVPDVAACLAAVDILEESTELVDRLWENTRYFKAGMKDLGFDTGNSVTPITPVMLGEAPMAQQFSRELFEAEVFAMALGFPTVPRDKARIRVMISASHAQQDLDRGLEAFASVGRKLGVIA